MSPSTCYSCNNRLGYYFQLYPVAEIADNLIFQKVDKVTKESAILYLIFTNRNLINKLKIVETLSTSDNTLLQATIMRKGETEGNTSCTLRKPISVILKTYSVRSMVRNHLREGCSQWVEDS